MCLCVVKEGVCVWWCPPPCVFVCWWVGGWWNPHPQIASSLFWISIEQTGWICQRVTVDVGFLSRVHPPSVGLRGKTQSAAIHADPAAMIWADDGHVGIISHPPPPPPPPQEPVLDPYCWVMKSHSWEGWAESQSGKPQKRWWCERVPLWRTDDEDLHSWTRWRFARVPNLQVFNSQIESHTFIVVLNNLTFRSLWYQKTLQYNLTNISTQQRWLYGIMWLLYNVDIVVWFSQHCSTMLLRVHCNVADTLSYHSFVTQRWFRWLCCCWHVHLLLTLLSFECRSYVTMQDAAEITCIMDPGGKVRRCFVKWGGEPTAAGKGDLSWDPKL